MGFPSRQYSSWMRHALALLVFSCLAPRLLGEATNVLVAPVPGWVQLCDWSRPTGNATKQTSEGARYLLHERQENPQRKESFNRVIRLMENQTGVQDCGSLRLGFDPAFQELLLHRVQIHRDGKVLDRLDRSKIKVIQPEPELDGDVLTGRQTAVLFVEDLRVGDALEYAYTLRGANPILLGHFSMRFVVQSSVPVDRLRLRVLWSSAKALHVRQHLTDGAPRKQTSNGATEYLWDYRDVEAIPFEDELPPGYQPYPYVELSAFEHWSEVVDWARPLYSSKDLNLPVELQELVAQWKRSGSLEERARLALEFVQDEVRYVGLELGPDSYRPTAPAETFRLRYGDCKAKAQLLCALMRAMNLEAYPALVNTSAREAIANRLPSPVAFNHVIVQAVVDGTTVWLDPTRSHQGGLLWNRYLPRFGKALVVKENVTTLEDIPGPNAGNSQRVTCTFELKTNATPTPFTVKTVYQGGEADSMREYFAGTQLKEVSKRNLNFYARYYSGVEEVSSLDIKDQRTLNQLEVTEHYQIRELWKTDKSNHQEDAVFYADSLEKLLTDPHTRLRKMPLGLSYPSRREQELIVHLPDSDWEIPATNHAVECEAFAFHYRRNLSGSTVRYHYDCQTRTQSVPAESVAGYLKKMEEMQDLLNDSLCRPDQAHVSAGSKLSDTNWLMVVIAGFESSIIVAGGLWLWRATKAAPVLAETAPESLVQVKLQGLSGWLVVVGIGLGLALISRVRLISSSWEGYFSLASWQAAAIPGGEQYHPLFGPLLIFELLGNTLLLGLNVLALCLFFAKRRFFPQIYVAWLLVNAVVVLVDELGCSQIPYLVQSGQGWSGRELVRAFVPAMIWIAYMLKSERVRATFIR